MVCDYIVYCKAAAGVRRFSQLTVSGGYFCSTSCVLLFSPTLLAQNCFVCRVALYFINLSYHPTQGNRCTFPVSRLAPTCCYTGEVTVVYRLWKQTSLVETCPCCFFASAMDPQHRQKISPYTSTAGAALLKQSSRMLSGCSTFVD